MCSAFGSLHDLFDNQTGIAGINNTIFSTIKGGTLGLKVISVAILRYMKEEENRGKRSFPAMIAHTSKTYRRNAGRE